MSIQWCTLPDTEVSKNQGQILASPPTANPSHTKETSTCTHTYLHALRTPTIAQKPATARCTLSPAATGVQHPGAAAAAAAPG